MVMVIAVTGSTGRLGGAVARRLARAGIPQRLLVRDINRAPRLPGALAYRSAYGDTIPAVVALAGTATAFMVSAAPGENRLGQHKSFVDAAVRAGVRHIVYTSFVGAAAAIAAGELATVTDDVERISGRPATPFEQLLRDAQRQS
jgi:NAD(P)H dehydrogenase (quinone)